MMGLLLILGGGDDDGPVQQVERHSMRGGVAGAPDLCNSSVCRHHNHRSHVVLHGAVEEGEALHVQHVNLVDEKHPRGNFRLPLFSPFRHLGVDLVPHLRFDLSCISTKKSEESLSPRINHIDLVQSDSVNHLFPLLKFSLWTLDKPRASPRSVIIPGSCKTPSQSCDLAGRLVDGDHVPCLHLLLDHRLDHLVAQVVYSFHFCCLEGQLSHLSPSAGGRSINLDFNNFPLNYLGLFADSHTNAFPERLSQCLCFTHFQGKYLRACHRSEGSVCAQGLCNTHGNCSFSCARCSSYQDSASGNFSFFDHLHNNASSPTRGCLTHHALRHRSWVKGVIKAETSDVTVGANPFDPCNFPDFSHLGSSYSGHLSAF